MDVLPEEGVSAETLLSVAYALEQPSEHPLAAAIVTYCKQQNIPLQPAEQFAQTAGQGVSGICNGMHCFGGNQKMMEANHISSPVQKNRKPLQKQAKHRSISQRMENCSVRSPLLTQFARPAELLLQNFSGWGWMSFF